MENLTLKKKHYIAIKILKSLKFWNSMKTEPNCKFISCILLEVIIFTYKVTYKQTNNLSSL